MTAPKTLLQLSGADLSLPNLGQSCLVLIDLQNEYRTGPLALPGADAAIDSASRLLARARAERGAIVEQLTPRAGEAVIEKALPNAFAGTDLQARLAATGRDNVVLAGMMTHMCVSSTARAALDLGLRVTIDAESCATRDLPDGRGGAITASIVHEVALAELSDRFAIIARDHAFA